LSKRTNFGIPNEINAVPQRSWINGSIVKRVIPGRRSEAEASSESRPPDLWFWIPGSRPTAEPRNDGAKVLPEHASSGEDSLDASGDRYGSGRAAWRRRAQHLHQRADRTQMLQPHDRANHVIDTRF
jgi:hypothetical protein